MVKKELIDRLSERSGLYKKDTEILLDALEEVITDAMVNGEIIPIMNVGKFMTKIVPEREARNPKTGEKVIVPAHRTMKFKQSNVMKDILSAQ